MEANDNKNPKAVTEAKNPEVALIPTDVEKGKEKSFPFEVAHNLLKRKGSKWKLPEKTDFEFDGLELKAKTPAKEEPKK